MKKTLALLGSTGSIGTQTLEVVRNYPERFRIDVLTAGQNVELLEAQIKEFQPSYAVIHSRHDADRLRAGIPSGTRVLFGDEGVLNAVTQTQATMVLNALVGSRGLGPTCKALTNGKDVALANKESLVAGGSLVMKLAAVHNRSIVPVDSEHSAIFQCLKGEDINDVRRIILTASGGPFLKWKKHEIMAAPVASALKHPNWSMRKKITIDSATMMNKGLEIIEAAWLFDLPQEKIDVVIHPQSIIHSMVEFTDLSCIAQLGNPDMQTPIQVALAWPERIPSGRAPLFLEKTGTLTFFETDPDRFPCVELARKALKIGKTMPCVLNAANDFLVECYMREEIRFYDLSDLINTVMEKHTPFEYHSLDELVETEEWVRGILRSIK